MYLFRETLLLFSLNMIDAFLTIFWVRSGSAPEANLLMADLLDRGDAPFLAAKITMGLLVAVVLLKWGNRRIAKYGVTVALTLYIGVMGIHFLTGLAAFGYATNIIPDGLRAGGAVLAMIF